MLTLHAFRRISGQGNVLADQEKERDKMNFFNNKKHRKIASIIILAVIAAMVLTMIIPYLV